MSTRLAAIENTPIWSGNVCINPLEQRCQHLIKPVPIDDIGVVDNALRAAGYHLEAGGTCIRGRLALDVSFRLGLSAHTAIDTTSIYGLIHFLEHAYDVHFAMGGTGAITKPLGELMARQGAA